MKQVALRLRCYEQEVKILWRQGYAKRRANRVQGVRGRTRLVEPFAFSWEHFKDASGWRAGRMPERYMTLAPELVDVPKGALCNRQVLAGSSRSPIAIVRRLMNRQGNFEHRDRLVLYPTRDQGTREKVT
jgi:hypothetical protein